MTVAPARVPPCSSLTDPLSEPDSPCPSAGIGQKAKKSANATARRQLMSMTRVLSHRSRWSIHSQRRENPTKTVTLGRKISLPEKAPFGGQSANPMKTVTWAAGRCPPGARFRVHLGDGGVHGPAVARPADASGNQDCALSEVGDLAHWTAIGGHCPDVGRCAVLERDGEPSVVGREREAVGIPGNPRSRVSIQDAFAIWRTGFEDLVAELIPSP